MGNQREQAKAIMGASVSLLKELGKALVPASTVRLVGSLRRRWSGLCWRLAVMPAAMGFVLFCAVLVLSAELPSERRYLGALGGGQYRIYRRPDTCTCLDHRGDVLFGGRHREAVRGIARGRRQ